MGLSVRTFAIVLFFGAGLGAAWAQEGDSAPSAEVLAFNKPNTLSVEALGRAGLWSLSYDRRITTALAFGIGISHLPISGTQSGGETFWISNFTIPVYGSLYVLGIPHQIFVTAGVNFGLLSTGGAAITVSRWTNSPIALVAGLGYEYRPSEGPLVRVTPYIYFGPAGLSVNLGLALGFGF